MYVCGVFVLLCLRVYMCVCVSVRLFVYMYVCNNNYERKVRVFFFKLKPNFATKARVEQQTTSDSSIPAVLPSCRKNELIQYLAPAHCPLAPTQRVDDKKVSSKVEGVGRAGKDNGNGNGKTVGPVWRTPVSRRQHKLKYGRHGLVQEIHWQWLSGAR